MARILVALRTAVVAVGAVAILSSGVAAQDTAHVCLQYGMSGAGSVYYDITTAPSGTVMKRYNMAANPPALVDTNGFAALHKPANNGDYWSEGIDFVAAMQSRQVWINQDPNQPAYWQRDTNTGEDTWLFTTTISGSPITLTFRTSQCTMGSGETTTAAPPPANNCPAAAQQPGVNCGAGTDCCGYGTMNPHCVAQGTGDHCCVWYLSSKTCNSTQTCCGMMGPGASSYAYCCDAGSTCCTASTGYSGTSTCCPTGSTCCRGSTAGVCCGPTEECVPNENRCRAAGAGETTTTNAPTVPATPPPVSVDSAHVCLQYGSVYYDITTNPSQTLMKRYNMAVNPPAFMDTNDFAALHKPANNGDYWSEGIDFVAAMQSRLVWINQEPNQPAYWEYNSATGESTWRFTTTISGSQVELTFRSSQCNM